MAQSIEEGLGIFVEFPDEIGSTRTDVRGADFWERYRLRQQMMFFAFLATKATLWAD